MFERLKGHKRENGDCLAPQLHAKDKQLGLWQVSKDGSTKSTNYWQGVKKN